MLGEIFTAQYKLQKRLAFNKIKNDSDKQQYINQMLLALYEETTEIMRCSAYKNPEFVKFGWKKNQKNDFIHMKEELTDAFHFIVNIALAIGMTAEEFFETYMQKNKENHNRQEQGY